MINLYLEVEYRIAKKILLSFPLRYSVCLVFKRFFQVVSEPQLDYIMQLQVVFMYINVLDALE
jgi:hypothetical protein